jgi:hypothetical protein
VLSPSGDDYEKLHDRSQVHRAQREGVGRAILRMAERCPRGHRTALYVQIEKYIIGPKADQATPSLKRILLTARTRTASARQRILAPAV